MNSAGEQGSTTNSQLPPTTSGATVTTTPSTTTVNASVSHTQSSWAQQTQVRYQQPTVEHQPAMSATVSVHPPVPTVVSLPVAVRDRVPPDQLNKESILKRLVPNEPRKLSDFKDSSGKIDYGAMAERVKKRRRKAVVQVDRPQPYASPALSSNPGTSSIPVPDPNLPEVVVSKDSVPDDIPPDNQDEPRMNKLDHSLLAYLQKVIDSNELHVIYGTQPLVVAVRDISVDMARFTNRYQVVERRALQFLMGRVEWVYMCSCDVKKADAVKHLSTTLQTTYDVYKDEHHSHCLHMQVAGHVFNQIDADLDISAEDVFNQDIRVEHQYTRSAIEDCVYPMVLPHHVCQFDRGQQRYGVVTIENGKFICLTCTKPSCCHTAYFKTLKDTKCELPDFLLAMMHPEEIEGKEEKTNAVSRTPKAVSRQKIPFERSTALASVLNMDISNVGNKDESGRLQLLPMGCCPHCGNESVGQQFEIRRNSCKLFFHSRIVEAVVGYRICTQCNAEIDYDGQEHGLLNMGTYMIGYDVLRHYMHSFFRGRRPMHTFFMTWCEIQLDHGNSDFKRVMSYGKFKQAWYAYIDLLDIEYTSSFTCPECGEVPDFVVCDGTSLSFMKQFMVKKPDMKGKQEETPIQGSDRMMLTAKCRKLLQQYANGKMQDDKSYFDTLLAILEDECSVLKNIILENDPGNFTACASHRPFLLSVASGSPMCSVIPSSDLLDGVLHDLLGGLDIRQYPDKMAILQEEAPILYHLLTSDTDLIPLSNVWKDMLRLLQEVAQKPFATSSADSHTSHTGLHEDSLSCFPSLPLVRERGHFKMDNTSGGNQSKCHKDFRGHPTLLPGIFTIFCKHGVCYGFQVMQSHESPNVPFTVFRTRFKSAPKVVAYDFACSLHNYCLNRDPMFFEHTRFVVDRFHWNNHKSCSRAYNMDLYPSLKTVNSQINEQANSGLKRIKDQVSYMTENNFMTHCRLYLFNKNKAAIADLQVGDI